MKNYVNPIIEFLIFDEEDIIACSTVNADYSSDQLNEFLFNREKTNTTTTIMLQEIKVSSN